MIHLQILNLECNKLTVHSSSLPAVLPFFFLFPPRLPPVFLLPSPSSSFVVLLLPPSCSFFLLTSYQYIPVPVGIGRKEDMGEESASLLENIPQNFSE
jgi:hypothetical protein